MSTINIKGRTIGDGFRPFIIAEGCDNHMGNLEKTQKKSLQAKFACGNCIKFKNNKTN